MDFGDYIYIILAIVFSIASALGKKRKANKKPVQSSKTRDIFEELFDVKSEISDPIPEMGYADDVEDAYSSEYKEGEEEVLLNDAPSKSDLQQKLSTLYSRPTPVESKEEAPNVVVEVAVPAKRHTVISDLRNRNELQKALIYSEIIQRKF